MAFCQNKNTPKAHRFPVETYGEHASVTRTCDSRFRQFKNVEISISQTTKKFEDEKLQALLGEDPTQS